MYDYYLKYNAVDGTLKKVISDGTETILTTDDLSGWEIVQEESKNVLVLKGLDFGTTCNYGLYVEGNESDTYVIRAQEDTNNSITVCYSGVEENSYGIYADSYNMNIIGVGALDVNVYTDNASISGMYASAFSIDTSSLNMNIKNTFQSGWNRAIYAKDTININSCIVDIDGVGEKVSAISSKLDMNLTTSNITVNIEAKTMNAIESTSGKVSFNKTILNCPSLKTTTDKSYVVYSYTLLEILNESDIDINFSSTECAETDSSYYTNKQVMLYSEMEINIDNSSIDITLDGYCVDVIIANQLGKYSLNGEINISNTSVNIDGNVNYVRGITTMFNQNDITLTGSNIVMNVAPKSNVSGYFSQYSCIYNDFRNINVVNTSVNLTLGETAIDESTVVRYAEGYGMFASRDIVMSSGSIIKVSGKGNDSEGIFYSDNITVNASKVDINLDSRISYNNNVFLAYENLNIINNSDIDIIVNSISTGTYKCSDTECTENHQYIQYGLNVENDLTITSSTLDMSLNSTRLMGIYCAGKTTITKGVLNCHDMLSTSQNSYIILSVGGLDILDNSDIDIDFTSTEASTVTKYDYNGNPYEAYAYTQYLIYSNGDINVNNSNINLDMDLCRGAGIECYGGNINIVNSKVDILDYKVDIFFGIEADEEYVADKTEYKGNILISNTKITMKGKQKYSEDKAYGIWSDWGAITIQESSKINIDMCANYIIGIEAYEKDVTFNDSYIDINTYSETSDSYTYGIYCSNAKVIMDKAIINMNIMTEGFTAIGTWYWSNESTDPDICITNSHIDIKGKGVTEDYGFGMSAGMRVNIDSSDVNIDIEGCVVRGIYGYQSVTIKNSNTIIYAGTESNSTTISCSQYSDENKKVSLLGGSAIFKGGMCAVDGNLTLDTSSDPNYGVIAASTLYDGSTLTEYNSANLSTYKYLVIGHNETYEYKYFASTGEIYANGSDTPLDATALADLGISIIKEGTSNVLVMNTLNITTSKDVALWTIGDVDIQLNDGSVNNLVTQGTTVADYYGIKVIGNIKLSGKGTLNLNKTSASDSDANYYGIYSYYDVNIEEENVDLADSKMKIIVSNQATIGNTYGLYASDTYTKCANVSIQVNENNSTSYGIYANNEIVMNDGQVEIIADKVVNVVPTLVNVAISDAVQDTTSIIPSDSNSIMNYNYVMIMPNYYLRYENGKMYINDSVTQASVVNWSVNLDGNLQLDNFIFKTVAKYGLCVVGVNTIALSENSSNYIDLKYMGQDTAYAIYSDSQLSIQSLDGDNKGTLYIDDCRSEKETGAIYSKENIIINQVDIVLSADVVTYKGIISDKAITFNKAVVNFADIKTKEGDSNVIQAKTGIDIINSSDIDVTFVSEDKTTYMYTNSYNQSFKKYKYTQNIIETYKNINITDSNVTMNNKACVSKGIVSYDGNISMTNANIDIITESDSAYVILADYKNEKMGASSVGKINILNSIINIDANQLVYEDDNINGGCVAINATNNAIEIKSSTIDLQMDLQYMHILLQKSHMHF